MKPGPLCSYGPLCKRGRASRSDDGGLALDFVRAKQNQERIPHGPLFQRGKKRQRNAGIQCREFLQGPLFQRVQQRLKPGPLCSYGPLCKRGRASRSDDGGFAFDFARAKQNQEKIPHGPLFQRGQKRRRNAGMQGREFFHGLPLERRQKRRRNAVLLEQQPKSEYQKRQAGRSA